MIPGGFGGLTGGLTNSGTMPIDAGGGASGAVHAANHNSFGGIKQGSINMAGGGFIQQLPLLLVLVIVGYMVIKK